MSQLFSRTATMLAVFTMLASLCLSACKSSGDSIADRRREAESDSSIDDSSITSDAEFDFSSEDAAESSDDGSSNPAPSEPEPVARGAVSGEARTAQDVLNAMSLSEQTAYHSADWWVKQGDEQYAARDYEAASKSYRTALDNAPEHNVAREKYNNTQMLLGNRTGAIAAHSKMILEQRRIEDQQTLEEIKRSLRLGKAAFEAKSLDTAERHIRTALDMIKTRPQLISDANQNAAKTLLRDIENARAQAQRDKNLENQRLVQRKVDEELSEQEKSRNRKIQDLLYKARRHMRLKDYRRALESCESVLALQPDNRVAIFWRNTSREQLQNLKRLDLMIQREDQEKLQKEEFMKLATPSSEGGVDFPVEQEWLKVRDRARRVLTTEFVEPEPIRLIKNQLEAQIIQDINFEDTPLSEVVDTFRQIAGVNILIDAGIDAEADEFKVSQPITNLSAMAALRHILDSKGLVFGFEESTMVISTKEGARPDTVFEVYNVSDLLTKIRDFAAPEIRLRSGGDSGGGESPISFTDDSEETQETLDPDKLIELIKDTTGGEEEAWVEGTSIDFSKGQLFVEAPLELHQKLQGVLESLRQDADLFVIIEARFIDVFDDFLEDVGIDARGLNFVDNLDGITPFGDILNDSSTGGNDLGIVEQGSQDEIFLVQGLDRWGGRVQHIVDGFSGTIRGDRLTGGNGLGGATFQATWLEPFQVNVILRAVQEKQDVRQLTAPVVTAHNNERVYVSVITQRAYIADYELVSGGTGFAIIEVADPVVQTFQEGVILDVDPTISHDKKYVTLDVRPTLATLIGGVISTINISLGSFTNVAFQVPIGIPQISLQQSFTSVTVPNGGTVLLGGFKSMDDGRFESYL
ncbi:MAG: hypothetical protein AAF517_20275, partial [Planctomycetota bacterium]